MKNLLIWVVVLGVLGYGGSKLYMHNKVSSAMDTAVLMMSPYAKVHYDGVSSTMTGELTVDGVQVRLVGFRDELYIDSIGIDTPSFLSLLELSDLMSPRSDDMPDYIGFIIEGLRIPADADYYEKLYGFMLEARGAKDADEAAAACVGKYGFSPAALSALGYEDQVMSMTMFLRNEKTNYSMEMTMGMEDMWDMDVNVALSGNLKSEIMKGPMYRPRLANMRMEVTDRSMNQRVVKYCGELGLSPQETFAAQLDSLKFIGEENGIEFDEYLIEPFKEFIKGKQTLVITARPNEPVAFSQIDLYKPSDVPALLNLAAVAR